MRSSYLVKRKRKKRRALGAPPGSLITDPDALRSSIHLIAYDAGRMIEQPIRSVEEISPFLKQWRVCWINVDGLGDAATLHALGDLFGIHRLALEDVVNTHQRPKTELYGDHVYVVTQMVWPGHDLDMEQLSLFLGAGYVLTFQERPGGDCLEGLRRRIRERRGRVRDEAADYLAYCILDNVLDAYFPHLDMLSDRIEQLEDQVLAQPTPQTVAGIHRLKHDLITVRRVIGPMRDAVAALLRDTGDLFAESTRVFLRDCHDHTFQILDLVESQREIAGSLLDVYLSSVSNRTNDIMKVLTIMSALFIPLTFIAGIYGMNFDTRISPWNMPELESPWGYPTVMLLMGSIAAIELALFFRMGWLRLPRLRRSRADERRKPPAPH